MQETILTILQKYLKSDSAIAPDMTLADLGLTSFGFIELVLRIESATALEFDDQYLNYLEFKTVGSLIAYCETLETGG